MVSLQQGGPRREMLRQTANRDIKPRTVFRRKGGGFGENRHEIDGFTVSPGERDVTGKNQWWLEFENHLEGKEKRRTVG